MAIRLAIESRTPGTESGAMPQRAACERLQAIRRPVPSPPLRGAGGERVPGERPGGGGGLLRTVRAGPPAKEDTDMPGIDFNLEEALSGSDLLTEIGLHPSAIQDVIDDNNDRRCPDTWSERGT